MGGFYGSIQVRTTDRAAVKAAAEAVATAKKIKCLIGPELGGWVGIYPEGNGQDDSVGHEIAKQLEADVLHLLVHDDDVLAYWLWRKHELVDSYWSKPGYFGDENLADEQARVGKPEMFRPIIGEKADRLAGVLDRETSSVFEYERLEKFAKLLGIRNAVTAYEYLKGGEHDAIKGWRKFEEVPESVVTSESEQRRAVTNHIKAERTRLLKSGALLHFEERKDQVTRICASGNDFIVVWPVHGGGVLSIGECQEPWSEVLPSAIESPSHITAVVSDATGNRLAFAAGDRIRIWDASPAGWQHLLDIPEADLAIGATISADGRLIAHASRNEIVVSELPTGRRLFSLPPRDQQQMAFHPSGKWVAAAGPKLALISVEDEPHQHEFFVGGKAPSGLHFGALQSQMATIDVDDLVKKKLASLEADIARMRQPKGKSNVPSFSEEQIESARQVMLKSIEAIASQLRAMKSGDGSRLPGSGPTAKESVAFVDFSRDGRWLFCATNCGLRVYDWESFPRESGGVTPVPVWQYDPPAEGAQGFGQHVNAVVEEAGGSGLVFGGWSGKLMRLDLHTGAVRHLLTLPGGGGVYAMAMTKNGGAFAVCSNFSRHLNRGTLLPDSHTLEIWAYPRLRESATAI